MTKPKVTPKAAMPKKKRQQSIAISRATFRDLPVLSVTEWDDVGKVRRALREMLSGSFTSIADFVDTILGDDRIKGVSDTRTNGILGLPRDFEGEEGAAADDEIATAASDLWDTMFPHAALRELMQWGHQLGVGFGELVYDTEDAWVPTLRVLHPRFAYWRWDTRSFWMVFQDGPVEVTPGNGKWVVFAPYGVERGWTGGLVRALAIPWLIRQWAHRDWARYSELKGTGIRQIITPAQAKNDDRQRAAKEIAKLGSESVVVTPQGEEGNRFDLKFHEAQANTYEGFDKLIARVDTAIAVAYLGQNLTTEVKGGSFAAADVHDRVRGDFIKADVSALTACLRDQVLKPWALFNYGDAEKAPKPRWHVDPPEDKSTSADVVLKIATATQAFKAAAAPVDLEELFEEFDVPVGEELEPVVPPASAGSDSPPGPDGGKQGGKPEKASRVALDALDGATEGQLYADELADATRDAAVDALAPDLAELLALVKKAHSYETLRAALVDAYGRMKPRRMAELMRKAMVLAQLNGRYSVLKEV